MLDIKGDSQVLFQIICVIFVLNIQLITLEYCMFEGFIKKKGQVGY